MSVIVQLIASAVEPGAFVERKLQRTEWIEVDGGEVVLRGVGGWAHGVLSRHLSAKSSRAAPSSGATPERGAARPLIRGRVARGAG